jgi:hypothetical protein
MRKELLFYISAAIVIDPEVNDNGGIAVLMLFRHSPFKSVLLIAIDIAQAASAKHRCIAIKAQ